VSKGKALYGIAYAFDWLDWYKVQVTAWLEDRKGPFAVSWSRWASTKIPKSWNRSCTLYITIILNNSMHYFRNQTIWHFAKSFIKSSELWMHPFNKQNSCSLLLCPCVSLLTLSKLDRIKVKFYRKIILL